MSVSSRPEKLFRWFDITDTADQSALRTCVATWLTFNSAQFNSLIAPKRRFSWVFVGVFSPSNSRSFPVREAFLFEFPVFPVLWEPCRGSKLWFLGDNYHSWVKITILWVKIINLGTKIMIFGSLPFLGQNYHSWVAMTLLGSKLPFLDQRYHFWVKITIIRVKSTILGTFSGLKLPFFQVTIIII